MKLEKIRMDEIIKYKNNPRNNEDAIEEVKKSIENYGYLNPILINKENVILAGHTRYEALKELGAEEVEVIRVDDLDKNKEKAFRIVDNKVAEYSYWDNEKLLKELKEFSDEMKEQLKDIGLEYSDEEEINEELFLTNEKVSRKEIICPFCGYNVK